jgi:hypothetical protein
MSSKLLRRTRNTSDPVIEVRADNVAVVLFATYLLNGANLRVLGLAPLRMEMRSQNAHLVRLLRVAQQLT